MSRKFALLVAGVAATGALVVPIAASAAQPTQATQYPTEFKCPAEYGFSVVHNGDWGQPTESGYYTIDVSQPATGPYHNETEACGKTGAFGMVDTYFNTGDKGPWYGPELIGDKAWVQNSWTGNWEWEYGIFAFAHDFVGFGTVHYTLNRQGPPHVGGPVVDAHLTKASQSA